jgi:hypothetical protein
VPANKGGVRAGVASMLLALPLSGWLTTVDLIGQGKPQGRREATLRGHLRAGEKYSSRFAKDFTFGLEPEPCEGAVSGLERRNQVWW